MNELNMVPGPTIVSQCCLDKYNQQYKSSDLESEFIELYVDTQKKLLEILGGDDEYSVAIQSGEAMVCLWGALKSVLKEEDKVLSIATGVFGHGIGHMAENIGAKVDFISNEYDQGITNDMIKEAEKLLTTHNYRLITVVHCETPSGVLHSSQHIKQLGQLAKENNALLYVDFVSSGGAVPVNIKENNIDLGLLGSQKVLNLPPDLGVVTISSRAWQIIKDVQYAGYDALLPYENAVANSYFPYTPNWRAIAALNCSCSNILKHGLVNIYEHHIKVSKYCREQLKSMGIKLFVTEESSLCSPTVTAAYIPNNFVWDEFNMKCKKYGLYIGGSYGKLANKVFRIGHMGSSQCQINLIKQTCDIIRKILDEKNKI